MLKRKIQSDIHDCSQYDADHKLAIRRIYDLIPSNLENKRKRVQINDITGKRGKCFSDYKEEFEYVISSGIGLEACAA